MAGIRTEKGSNIERDLHEGQGQKVGEKKIDSHALLDPADAPKDCTMILGDFGWPWLCPAVWDSYDEDWAYATVQASPMIDGGDNVWLEMETAKPKELKGWIHIPDLIKQSGAETQISTEIS